MKATKKRRKGHDTRNVLHLCISGCPYAVASSLEVKKMFDLLSLCFCSGKMSTETPELDTEKKEGTKQENARDIDQQPVISPSIENEALPSGKEHKKHKKEKKTKKAKKEKHKKHKHKHKKHHKNAKGNDVSVPLALGSKRIDLDKLTDLQDLEKAKAFLQVSQYTLLLSIKSF